MGCAGTEPGGNSRVHLGAHAFPVCTQPIIGALQNGVPLVVTDWQSDTPEIRARVAWSGSGVRLRARQPSPSALRAAVRKVLADVRFRARASELASRFAVHRAGEESAALLEQLAATWRPVLRGAGVLATS